MPATSEDFGRLYRNALAERDPERKQVLLRCVQETLDAWAQAGAAQPRSRPVSAGHGPTTVEVRITQGGVYERSLSSVA